MSQEAQKREFFVLPKKQFKTMALLSVVIGLALHFGIAGKPLFVAFGMAVGQSIPLIAMVCLVPMVPAGIYWLIKRKRMPGLSPLIWILWASTNVYLAITLIDDVRSGLI